MSNTRFYSSKTDNGIWITRCLKSEIWWTPAEHARASTAACLCFYLDVATFPTVEQHAHLEEHQSKSGCKAIFKAHCEKFRFLFEQFKHLRHAARGFNLIAHNHQSLLPLESTCAFPPEAPTAVWCRKMVSLVAMM